MARTKKAPRSFTIDPKNLPEGLILAKVPKKLNGKDGPVTTLEVIAPEESGAGIIAYQKMYESIRTKDGKAPDPDANVLTARALLALATDSQVAALRAQSDFSGFAFPRAPRTRVLDPAEAYLEEQGDFIRKNRRPPTSEESAAMYAKHFG